MPASIGKSMRTHSSLCWLADAAHVYAVGDPPTWTSTGTDTTGLLFLVTCSGCPRSGESLLSDAVVEDLRTGFPVYWRDFMVPEHERVLLRNRVDRLPRLLDPAERHLNADVFQRIRQTGPLASAAAEAAAGPRAAHETEAVEARASHNARRDGADDESGDGANLGP